ncbi:glycoside hydrolase [Coprobacter sp.]
MNKQILFYIVFLFSFFNLSAQRSLILNGLWQVGENRNYDREAQVPGIATDPAKMNSGTLWYKKQVTLPKGDWSSATLELKGARFMPEVYVDGVLVSKRGGGMASTFHSLKGVKPGRTITLEIALSSLKDVPRSDASYIPSADQWRSNISSSLWDDVILYLHGAGRIGSIIPDYDLSKKNVDVKFNVEGKLSAGRFCATITDKDGNVLFSEENTYKGGKGLFSFNYTGKLKEWTPENPELYTLNLVLYNGKKISDQRSIHLGIKNFAVKNKQFYLNGAPYKLRGGTVVWHRWVRSEEGRVCGYDTAWFAENIIRRLKDHGANLLRFHLGTPPDRLLDLCDKMGILVQYEWSFFHGMPASRNSLMEQYPAWIDRAMLHPSIALYHPYNETEGEQLNIVWSALNEIVNSYPPLVLAERDVIHIHKYWWSLFENVGVYFDSADQFDKAIMVDEFGGNYLDEKGDLGGYKALKESYLRFLGRKMSRDERLKFHAMTNSRVAEYWRRIGAAGVAPFAIASSWEDGNTWFLGALQDGSPKPVWNALTATYSPQSVSLDIWDRNFVPGEKISFPVCFFNDKSDSTELSARLTVEDRFGKIYSEQIISAGLSGYSKISRPVNVVLPEKEGRWLLKAELCNRPESVSYPVVSEWEIHTFRAQLPEALKEVVVAVPENEKELLQMLRQHEVKVKPLTDKSVRLLLLSDQTWNNLKNGDVGLKQMIRKSIDRGISVVWLNVGEQYLGQGYPDKNGKELGPLQGVVRITDPVVTRYEILDGVELIFTEAAEPESHLHADLNDSTLWNGIPKDYTWLWNGMRGGLLVPAADMEITGLSRDAFIRQWAARGADVEKIKQGSYYAYELQGFYAYSTQETDVEVQKQLRNKVIFLVEDAPALASSINTASPIRMIRLSEEYQKAVNGNAQRIVILANAGKNLTRTPVVRIDFGEGRGRMLVSQLLTSGRLCRDFSEKSFYGKHYDEVAVQMVFNMMNHIITQK